MKERVKFILEWEKRWNEGEGVVNMSELCRVFGICRQTGYKCVNRYLESGRDLRALEERPRRPHASPHAIADELADQVVAARKLHPRWGPRKLRAWLTDRHPQVEWPSASWMGELLRRRGLTRSRRPRRRRAMPSTQPFSECDAPNSVWCIDFKGKFRLEDGKWCHVLTLLDAYSRFLLRCEALLEPNTRHVEAVCDSAFQEFGLPAAIRSDNGPPFASTGAGGLSVLSVWWLRLGIRLERIQPGKPQQNGRQERVHLTLEEVVNPPAATVRAQQRALDLWRREYNEERPHEALGQKPPESAYCGSARRYPRRLLRPEPSGFAEEHRLDKHGRLRWNRRKILISAALAYEFVHVEPLDFIGTKYEVRFGTIRLGTLDASRPDRGFIQVRRRRRPRDRLSAMSLD